jgi:acetylornithine deacetylase/succinyl-diaminopimelate desuccinylase-like protein
MAPVQSLEEYMIASPKGLRPSLLVALALSGSMAFAAAQPQKLGARQQLARDIYEELVEINTSQSVGDTFKAAEAMAARLKAAGFPDADVRIFQTAPKRGNLVARLRGTGKRKPMLLLAHIDVVEANREDWTTDPYEFVEKDGYYYGRGTGDDKYMAAAFIANLIRYRQEGYKPDRDLILALTTDEEISDQHNYGINFLLQQHRDLIDAEFALNEGGGVALKEGKPVWNSVQTTEKLFQSYWLEVRNKGGHSSQPTQDNAIYRLAAGLERLAKYDFPLLLNDTTRVYFQRMSEIEKGQVAADMKAIVASRPDAAAVQRLSQQLPYNAIMRTTCVATRLDGGHADNALPQLARAMVNCRIAPGSSVDAVQKTLTEVMADEQIKVAADRRDTASEPSPMNPEIFGPIEKLTKKFWPGTPVLPTMSAGATDSRFLRNAGIPSYGHSGLAADVYDVRAHGKDERVAVSAFFEGQEYLYQLVKALAGGK